MKRPARKTADRPVPEMTIMREKIPARRKKQRGFSRGKENMPEPAGEPGLA